VLGLETEFHSPCSIGRGRPNAEVPTVHVAIQIQLSLVCRGSVRRLDEQW